MSKPVKPAHTYIVQFGYGWDEEKEPGQQPYLARQFEGVRVRRCTDLGEFQKALTGIPPEAQIGIVISDDLQSIVLGPHNIPASLQQQWKDTHPMQRGSFVLKHLEALVPGITMRPMVVAGVDCHDYSRTRDGKLDDGKRHEVTPVERADETFRACCPDHIRAFLQRQLDLKQRGRRP